jgi:putative addiction module component (TIGR02574 family)
MASMASVALAQLRDKVLELPEEDRAELAHELLVSLDGPAENGVAEAWADEIERRVADLDSGAVKPIAAEEVARRLLQRLVSGR